MHGMGFAAEMLLTMSFINIGAKYNDIANIYYVSYYNKVISINIRRKHSMINI